MGGDECEVRLLGRGGEEARRGLACCAEGRQRGAFLMMMRNPLADLQYAFRVRTRSYVLTVVKSGESLAQCARAGSPSKYFLEQCFFSSMHLA